MFPSIYPDTAYLPSVDGGRRAPSLETQAGVPARGPSNVLLWTGAAAKRNLAT